jgi:hypothetical protein
VAQPFFVLHDAILVVKPAANPQPSAGIVTFNVL